MKNYAMYFVACAVLATFVVGTTIWINESIIDTVMCLVGFVAWSVWNIWLFGQDELQEEA